MLKSNGRLNHGNLYLTEKGKKKKASTAYNHKTPLMLSSQQPKRKTQTRVQKSMGAKINQKGHPKKREDGKGWKLEGYEINFELM